MVVIFGKQLNMVKPLISNRGINKDDDIFLSNDGEIDNNTNDLCRIFNNYFTHIANSICVDGTIYQDDTCESCICDHDNHRSIGQIRNLMALAHTGETHFSFTTVDVAVRTRTITITITLLPLSEIHSNIESKLGASIFGKTKTNRKYNRVCNMPFTTMINSCF